MRVDGDPAIFHEIFLYSISHKRQKEAEKKPSESDSQKEKKLKDKGSIGGKGYGKPTQQQIGKPRIPIYRKNEMDKNQSDYPTRGISLRTKTLETHPARREQIIQSHCGDPECTGFKDSITERRRGYSQ